MLKTRLLTAAVALPAVLAAILYAPPLVFTALIGVLGGWGLYEVGSMTQASDAMGIFIVLIAGGAPLVCLLAARGTPWLVPAVIIAAMLALVARVAMSGAESAPHGKLLTLLGALYVGVLFPYFALLRNLRDGIAMLILMLLLVVATDSAAYVVGSSVGRIKLAPRVSPNKTVEGSVGGLVGAVAVGILLRGVLAPEWRMGQAALVSVVVSVLAQLGDLAGSALKRASGVKDSGWVFPGHGGLIDRTCSLVFAAVFTYYYIR